MFNESNISIIIPTYNGEKSINLLIENLVKNFPNYEIVIINDNSPDKSDEVCRKIIKRFQNNTLIYLKLAKNCGEHSAVLAGLNECSGNMAVIIDDDFQHPISEIKKIINFTNQNNYDVVYSKFTEKKHSLFRNFGSWINDKSMNFLFKKPKKLYLSSFKTIKRNIINEIVKFKLGEPYLDALILKITSNIGQVLTEHAERDSAYGKSSYSFRKLLKLYASILFGYSTSILRVVLFTGLFTFLLSLLLSIIVLIERILNPDMPVGYSSIIFLIMIFGSLNLIFIGLLGEYIGRILNNTNNFLSYFIENKIKTKGIKKN